MSASWKTKKLSQLVTFSGGGTPSRSNTDFFLGNIPWASPKDMKTWRLSDTQEHISEEALEQSSAKLVPSNAVLLVIRSGILKHTLPIAISEVPLAINQDMKALVCGSETLPEFLAYCLKSQEQTILGWVRATTADNLPFDMLKNLLIPVPTLDVQSAIVARLNRIQTIIDGRRRTLKLLDALRSALFIEMFGDPTSNPFNFPIRQIGDIVSTVTYGTSKKAGPVGRFPILRMNNITYKGGWDFSELKHIDLEPGEEDRYCVRQGDILFNRTNSKELVGKTAVYPKREQIAYAGYLIRVRVMPDQNPQYLSAFLNSDFGKSVLRSMCKSIIGMANINAQELKSIDLPVPPKALQDDFALRLEKIESLGERLTKSLLQLELLFMSCLHTSFSNTDSNVSELLVSSSHV
ncbi:MAG: restriction endonuclease subunit S [Candidatus Obscuribacterales bacterium]|nr:restriction endonuclease subunit S [Candidatus Obscuribacterales bacterium]